MQLERNGAVYRIHVDESSAELRRKEGLEGQRGVATDCTSAHDSSLLIRQPNRDRILNPTANVGSHRRRYYVINNNFDQRS